MLDPEQIINGLVASFIGGWWSWITFGFLKLKKDMDAAHKKLRGDNNVATDHRTSMDKDRNPDLT